jgi:hypothetical protein
MCWYVAPQIVKAATFEVITVMKIYIAVFWAVTSCSVMVEYRRFGGLHGLDIPPETDYRYCYKSGEISSTENSSNPGQCSSL